MSADEAPRLQIGDEIVVSASERANEYADGVYRPLGAQFRADAAMKRKRACGDCDDDADDESD